MPKNSKKGSKKKHNASKAKKQNATNLYSAPKNQSEDQYFERKAQKPIKDKTLYEIYLDLEDKKTDDKISHIVKYLSKFDTAREKFKKISEHDFEIFRRLIFDYDQLRFKNESKETQEFQQFFLKLREIASEFINANENFIAELKDRNFDLEKIDFLFAKIDHYQSFQRLFYDISEVKSRKAKNPADLKRQKAKITNSILSAVGDRFFINIYENLFIQQYIYKPHPQYKKEDLEILKRKYEREQSEKSNKFFQFIMGSDGVSKNSRFEKFDFKPLDHRFILQQICQNNFEIYNFLLVESLFTELTKLHHQEADKYYSLLERGGTILSYCVQSFDKFVLIYSANIIESLKTSNPIEEDQINIIYKKIKDELDKKISESNKKSSKFNITYGFDLLEKYLRLTIVKLFQKNLKENSELSVLSKQINKNPTDHELITHHFKMSSISYLTASLKELEDLGRSKIAKNNFELLRFPIDLFIKYYKTNKLFSVNCTMLFLYRIFNNLEFDPQSFDNKKDNQIFGNFSMFLAKHQYKISDLSKNFEEQNYEMLKIYVIDEKEFLSSIGELSSPLKVLYQDLFSDLKLALEYNKKIKDQISSMSKRQLIEDKFKELLTENTQNNLINYQENAKDRFDGLTEFLAAIPELEAKKLLEENNFDIIEEIIELKSLGLESEIADQLLNFAIDAKRKFTKTQDEETFQSISQNQNSSDSQYKLEEIDEDKTIKIQKEPKEKTTDLTSKETTKQTTQAKAQSILPSRSQLKTRFN